MAITAFHGEAERRSHCWRARGDKITRASRRPVAMLTAMRCPCARCFDTVSATSAFGWSIIAL